MGPTGVPEEGAAVGPGVGEVVEEWEEREEGLVLEEMDGVGRVMGGVDELDVIGSVVDSERMVVNQVRSVSPL